MCSSRVASLLLFCCVKPLPIEVGGKMWVEEEVVVVVLVVVPAAS